MTQIAAVGAMEIAAQLIPIHFADFPTLPTIYPSSRYHTFCPNISTSTHPVHGDTIPHTPAGSYGAAHAIMALWLMYDVVDAKEGVPGPRRDFGALQRGPGKSLNINSV